MCGNLQQVAVVAEILSLSPLMLAYSKWHRGFESEVARDLYLPVAIGGGKWDSMHIS